MNRMVFCKANTLAKCALTLGIFLFSLRGFAQTSDFSISPVKSAAMKANSETSPMISDSGETLLKRPIGHTLQTPEAQKRIHDLIRRAQSQSSGLKVERVSNSLPALVGGEYGFGAPLPFQGVPKAFVSLGDIFPAYGIVVEKLHHRLSVFRLNEDRKYEIVKTFRAITGKDPEDKKSTGDLRTPEGIYFVTGKVRQALPKKYGSMAFELDYPNIFDRSSRKSGHGIWIHATHDPQRLLKPYDTEGCVVLSNEDLTEVKQFISYFKTPVVITKEMTSGTFEEIDKPRKKALEFIEAWRASWENSDFDTYDAYYSKNFKSLGKGKVGWQKFKRTLSNTRKGQIQVLISSPKILAFEDQLLVVFQQDYRSPEHNDKGTKFLYLKWEGDGYRIIAEKWMPNEEA